MYRFQQQSVSTYPKQQSLPQYLLQHIKPSGTIRRAQGRLTRAPCLHGVLSRQCGRWKRPFLFLGWPIFKGENVIVVGRVAPHCRQVTWNLKAVKTWVTRVISDRIFLGPLVTRIWPHQGKLPDLRRIPQKTFPKKLIGFAVHDNYWILGNDKKRSTNENGYYPSAVEAAEENILCCWWSPVEVGRLIPIDGCAICAFLINKMHVRKIDWLFQNIRDMHCQICVCFFPKWLF